METLISYFKLALNSVKNNYVNFSGRATRTEYFSVLVSSLFLFIIAGILLIVPVLGTIIFVLYILAVILPLLAVSARRLHDVGKPAWYILVPFGLGIVALVIAGIGYSSFSVGIQCWTFEFFTVFRCFKCPFQRIYSLPCSASI